MESGGLSCRVEARRGPADEAMAAMRRDRRSMAVRA
jgi:hypothetical protein